jgi:hypothetical protein
LADLINISQGKINPKEFFSDEKMEDVVGFTYDDYTVYNDKIEIGCDLDSVDQDLSSYYWAYKNGYEAFDFNSDEFDYLFNYIEDEDKPKWIKVLKFLDKDFKESDFEEEGKIYKIMSEGPAEKYFNRALEDFAIKYEQAVNSAQDKWIDSVMKESPFIISTYSITFDYKKTIDYCLKTSFVEPENFKDILENWMNKEGLTNDNYWDYYNNDTDYSEARNSLSENIDNIIEELENDEDFQATLKNKEKLDKFIKDLKFIKGYNDYHLDTEFARIKIKKINLEDNELYIQYFDLKNNQNHEGLISIDDLPKYSTVPMMFEVRSQIRKIIKDIF